MGVPNRLGMKDWIVLETQEDAYNMRVVAGKPVQPEGGCVKHARADYNDRIQDSAKLIPENEPVFLIRGQDQVSADAVRAWAHLHRNNSGSDRVYELAMQHADLMEDWQRTIKSKKADVPEGV